MPELQTRRLILRPLEIADAPDIQELFPHWEIVRHLSNQVPWPYPPDGAECFIREKAVPQMESEEAWYWTLRLKKAPEHLIGIINLVKGDLINRGFWVGLEWQGQGYMTEACAAATDYWFDVLKFPVLRTPKSVANEASRRISMRQGMRLVATEEHDFVEGRLPAEIWEISAEEWRANREKVRSESKRSG
ncbi:MAG TPA: GNAT family N-acetyltransferase [Candidatus Acidoferrales bacterium]|nr:GNAT family N-acetyltransferase [Candidatus Acidoferrales bacterium]